MKDLEELLFCYKTFYYIDQMIRSVINKKIINKIFNKSFAFLEESKDQEIGKLNLLHTLHIEVKDFSF